MSESIAQTWQASAPVVVPRGGAHPGSIIRLARLARGETQTQTGRACGFSQSQISRLESGRAYAYDIRHLTVLARHLDIPPNLLGLASDSVDPSEPPVNRREFVTAAAAAIAGGALGASPRRDDQALPVTGAQSEVDAGFTSELVRSRWLGTDSGDEPILNLTELRRAVDRAKTDY